MHDLDVDDHWIVTRSPIDDRTWVPVPMGFGEQTHMTCAGPLRAVKWYVEQQEGGPVAWTRVDRDNWKGVPA